MFSLSIITAQKPKQISKGFRLDDGKLIKTAGGALVSGSIETRTFSSLDDFSEILQELTPEQALVYGTPRKSATSIVTRKMAATMGHDIHATTRTNDDFAWPAGGGVLMLDYDAPNDSNPLSRDELLNAVRAAAHGLNDVKMLWFPSASSCIYEGETEHRGICGQRIYVLVKDASDIPRAGKALSDRLWLAGFGHIAVSASGALLERTIVDTSVWQPSRLDFAGGASCETGLEQRRGVPFITDGTCDAINSLAAIPEINPQDHTRVTALKANAKQAKRIDADRVRETWIETRIAEMVGQRPDHDDYKRAYAVASRALDLGVLGGDFVIHVEKDAKITTLTVGEALDNPNRWHGAHTLDPVEPDYDGRRRVGRLFLLQARPVLHSFAHGGRAYRLHRAPERVEVARGHTADASNTTVEVLRNDALTFDFGGELATVAEGRVHVLCQAGLSHHLGAVTQFWRTNKDGTTADIDPPEALLKQVLALGARRKLKPLDGVITGPTVRADGSIVSQAGYDPTTRLLFDPMGNDVPTIPDSPTLDEASQALNVLMLPFASFPFVDANARGALLAGLLTAAVRAVIPTAPAIAFDAPIQGSGKSLLAACVGALAEGRSPDVWPHTQGRDDEEVRKRLFTALRSGAKSLIWDNVIGTFDSAAMAAFLTADAMIDRVLGKSEAVRVPNRALLILTGNNLTLAGDMPRRVLICRIDPQTDQPFARKFDVDPLAHIIDHRMEMLAAAATLIRARFVHTYTPAAGRLASFESWDDLVRQTVVWADTMIAPFEFGDPMDLIRESQAADPEADALFALLDALRDQFGTREFTAKDVVVAASDYLTSDAVSTAIRDIAGDKAVTSQRSLGRVLKFREGRIVHGLRLVGRADLNAGTRVYRVTRDENTGLTGITGFPPVTREKTFLGKGRETNPSNPLNPFTHKINPT